MPFFFGWNIFDTAMAGILEILNLGRGGGEGVDHIG